MGASRTWHLPVRGRFSFKPNERQKMRAPEPRRRVVIESEPSPGGPKLPGLGCYHCGRYSGHEPGCPKRT